jgi:hypothetical protein
MRPLPPIPILVLLSAALAAPAASGCSKKKKPDPERSASRDAAARAATAANDAAAAARPRLDPRRVRELAGELVDAWIAAQNRGDFAAYSALYAPAFRGVRRSGGRVVELDRAGWLADRKRMFAKPMEVLAEHRVVTAAGSTARIELLQTWSSGTYKDRGPKVLEMVLDGDRPLISAEEMLSSTILLTEKSALAALDPDNPAAGQAQCIPVDKASRTWACVVVTSRERSSLSCDVALLRRDINTWIALAKGPAQIDAGDTAGSYDPGDVVESASALLGGVVDIGPKQRAVEVSLEASSAVQIEASQSSRVQKTALYWIDGDSLEPVLEVSSTWKADVDHDESQTERYEILSTGKVRGGFYDVRVERRSEEHSWPVDEHDESTETEVLEWSDGYN